MNVGQRLKEVRKSRGFILKEAATGAGVDLKIYQAYEAGRGRTPISVILALSEFYGYYSVDKLLGLKPTNTPDPLLDSYLKADPEIRSIIDTLLKRKKL